VFSASGGRARYSATRQQTASGVRPSARWKGVDGGGAVRPVRLGDLVQAVEQRQQAPAGQPVSADGARDLVAPEQLVGDPVGQRQAPAGPGG
jgi:hypothetical protein